MEQEKDFENNVIGRAMWLTFPCNNKENKNRKECLEEAFYTFYKPEIIYPIYSMYDLNETEYKEYLLEKLNKELDKAISNPQKAIALQV